jgi:hypothetical protein
MSSFPQSPVDPDLGDWIMDLLEADTYYAGLAQSALAGTPFNRPPEDSLAELADTAAPVAPSRAERTSITPSTCSSAASMTSRT